MAVVAGVLVWAAASAPRALPEAAPAPVEPPPVPEPPAPPAPARRFGRRLATSFAFAVFFFAGAALAAGAGNVLVANDGGPPLVAAATTDEGTTTDDPTTTTTDEVATTDDATTTPDDVTTEAPLAPPVETDSDALTPAPAPVPVPAATLEPPAPPARASVPVRRHVAVPAPAPATPTAPPPVAPFPVVPFDPQAWLADNPGTPAGNAVVAIAMHYLGVPYRWGGNTPATGFDCSGLTQYVYAQLGIWLPHYAAAQFLAFPRLDPSQLEPGDLVFFEPKADGPGHTAIYAGHGAIIEAPHTGATVRVGSLAGAAAALGFLGAVRPTATGLARELAASALERGPGTWFVVA